jgi:hypothetical protein
MGRDLLQACLEPQQTSQLDRAVQKIETAALAVNDPEPRLQQEILVEVVVFRPADVVSRRRRGARPRTPKT